MICVWQSQTLSKSRHNGIWAIPHKFYSCKHTQPFILVNWPNQDYRIIKRQPHHRLRYFVHLARAAPTKDHHRVIAAALQPPSWLEKTGQASKNNLAQNSRWRRQPQNFRVHTAWRTKETFGAKSSAQQWSDKSLPRRRSRRRNHITNPVSLVSQHKLASGQGPRKWRSVPSMGYTALALGQLNFSLHYVSAKL